MTREKLLETAKQIVCNDRNGQYGEPEDSFSVIAGLWSVYLDTNIDKADVAAMMILMKVARISESNGTSSDSWVDIAGYAACGSEIALGDEGGEIQC